jgi:hypothetical protein
VFPHRFFRLSTAIAVLKIAAKFKSTAALGRAGPKALLVWRRHAKALDFII